MTIEIAIFTLLLLTLIGLVLAFRLSEARRLRKKTSEAMSASLREEIEKERQENLEKKQKFENAMKIAGGK